MPLSVELKKAVAGAAKRHKERMKEAAKKDPKDMKKEDCK